MAHNKYIRRQSPFYQVEHRKDENHQLGFDYRGEVLKRTLSPVLYNDEKRVKILQKLDELFVNMIDNVKNIKKTFIYSVERNSRNIN